MTEDRIKLFIERCIDGDASPDDISLYIQEWRDRDSAEPLEDYLGLTFEEFEEWLDHPQSLPHIIAARKNNIPLSDYLQNAQADSNHQLESSDEDQEHR
jgi:hypothetical protein